MVPRVQRDGSLRPYSRHSRPEPLLFLLSISWIVLTRLSGPSTRPTTSQKIWLRWESNPDLWICSKEFWALDHRCGRSRRWAFKPKCKQECQKIYRKIVELNFCENSPNGLLLFRLCGQTYRLYELIRHLAGLWSCEIWQCKGKQSLWHQ
jgi:hypothetical protein